MISEELRERLSRLNREPAPWNLAIPAVQPRQIESLIPGDVIADSDHGQFYRVRRSLPELNARKLAELAHLHAAPADGPSTSHPDLDDFARSFPTNTLFLDIETCGFSGAPLFLVGLIRHCDGQLVVEQLLARDYTEERAVLTHLWQIVRAQRVMVTFNGKSFDWPFIIDRSAAHRLYRPPGRQGDRPATGLARSSACESVDANSAPGLTHCDLLHLARRYWKKKHELPNCRLQTLELVLCGRRRHGDIPGYLIGDAYHRFVRSGDARHLEGVLRHNAIDLVTLAQLALLLASELDPRRDEAFSLEVAPSFG